MEDKDWKKEYEKLKESFHWYIKTTSEIMFPNKDRNTNWERKGVKIPKF